jgi:hypothetical protein
MWRVGIFFVLGFLGLGCFGMSLPSAKAEEGYSYQKHYDHDGAFWVFGGADIGIQSVTASSAAAQEARFGWQWGLRGLAAFYFLDWVGDLGGGWERSVTRTSLFPVALQTGFFFINPRLRVSKEWSVGPYFEYQYGAGADLSYNEVKFDPATITSATMLGATAYWETFLADSTRARLGVIATTDLSVSDRQVWNIQFSAQIGFPIRLHKDPPPPEPVKNDNSPPESQNH